MADDAGALLVRSGLVSSSALDDARARVASIGGTLGEQLVTNGAIADDALTDFYRSRLLVPQVNPNTLARLTPKVVGMLPGDMAIELRAIPVSIDGDNTLTVAMSDPSDRNAVDEIAFFTGTYVVRAVATQMQIAWCLAHYYGHVTALGQRLLHTAQSPSRPAAQPARTKGLTGKVNATRHRAIAPITGPINVLRPSSTQLDQRPLAQGSTDAHNVPPPSQPAGPAAPRDAAPPPAQPATLATPPRSAAPPPPAQPATLAAPPRSAAPLPAQPATLAAPPRSAAPLLAQPAALAGATRDAAPPAAQPDRPSSGSLPAKTIPHAGAPPRSDVPAIGSPGATPPPPTGSSSAAVRMAPTSLPDPSTNARGAQMPPGFPAPSSTASSASRPAPTPQPASSSTASSASRPAPTPQPASSSTDRVSRPSPPFADADAETAGHPPRPFADAEPDAADRPPRPFADAVAETAGHPPLPFGDDAAAEAGRSPDSSLDAQLGARPAALAVDPGHGETRSEGSQTGAASSSGIPFELSELGGEWKFPLSGAVVPRAAPDAPTLPPLDDAPIRIDSRPDLADEADPSQGAPDRPRARSVSGEIRVPLRRAPSIRPPLPELDDDDDEPMIVIERASDDEATGPRRMMPRRRAVKSDPPELRARAGEVDLKVTGDHSIVDEPRIVIDQDALSPPTAPVDSRGVRGDAPPLTTIDVVDDADTGAVIHDRGLDDADTGAVIHDRLIEDADTGAVIHDRGLDPDTDAVIHQRAIADADAGAVANDRIVDRASEIESQPILLDRLRATPPPLQHDTPTLQDLEDPADLPDDDTGESDIVILEARKPPRADRRTQVGVPPPVSARTQRLEAIAAVDREGEQAADTEDPTKLDLRAAPPGEETTSEQLAVPPGPASELDTNPYVIAPPPQPAPPRHSTAQPATIVDDDDEGPYDDDQDRDDGAPRGPQTSEMTAAELDDAIPERTAELDLGMLARHRIDYDALDDGWGPPGTTIPPPLLGAIPGSDDDDEEAHVIPVANLDSAPLMVGPPTPPNDPAGLSLARTLEDATSRAIGVIRQLEHATSRDDVVEILVAYLAETHHRAGFFVTRHGVMKGVTELGVFAMIPRPAVLPFATLRLDRPSTLQDVVGTRLPYRGPMHDDTSRGFLISALGACPAEILLVPVAVRERVVGVLFGEHRKRHTFDDQLALAARAAGMALERILRAKRS